MLTTTIRINYELYERLTKRALKEERSVNKEIVHIIKSYLEMIEWNKTR